MTRRTLRILFGTIEPGMPGGIHVTETAFQEALARSGEVEVRPLAFGRRRPDESRFERIVVRAVDLVVYAWRVLRERPDLVHLNTAFDRRALVRDVGYAVLSRLLGQRLFLKFHGSDATLLETSSGFWRWMTRTTIGGASGIGVLSTEEKRNFVAAGYRSDRFVVVKNVVDRRRFAGAAWPRPSAGRLLFIARMVPAKGLTDVIRAVRILRDRGRSVTLDCVGDGPDRAQAEALVATMDLGHVVHFTGLVPEDVAANHYLEAGMLVFPTRHPEGFSMTIFQSLAAGLPILTTRVRAAADYLREPDHCLWVPPGDPQALAERVEWLLDHPEVAARMSATARERSRAFDAEPIAREYMDLYRRLMDGGPASPPDGLGTVEV